MKTKKLAKVIFYSDGEFLLQDRRGVSKQGETIGFFGGGVEQGETPEKALRRELKEELDYETKKIDFLFKYDKQIIKNDFGENLKLIRYVYLSPITKILRLKKVIEGNGKILVKLDKLVKLKGLNPGDKEILKLFTHQIK